MSSMHQRARVMGLLLGPALGCGEPPAPPPTNQTRAPAAPEPATASADVVHPDAIEECGPAPRGLHHVIDKPRTTLLGEAYGTTEIPAFVGLLACHAAARGTPVGIGFEADGDQGDAFERFLDSDGSHAARSALLEAPHWVRDRDLADGRSSVAMLELFERARRLRARGRSVFVFPVGPITEPERAGNRDEFMAERVAEARQQHPDAALLVLAGREHTERHAAAEEKPDISASMGWVLANEHRLPMLSLTWLPGGGARWNPAGPGYQSEVGGESRDGGAFIALDSAPAGADGVFYVGPTTASPPAYDPEALSP